MSDLSSESILRLSADAQIVETPDGVVFSNTVGRFILRGADASLLARRLPQLLDGLLPLSTITAGLSLKERMIIDKILRGLLEKRLLIRGPPTPFGHPYRQHLEFIERVRDDAASVFQDFQAKSVLIKGDSPWRVELQKAFRHIGVSSVAVCDELEFLKVRGQATTSPKQRAELVVLAFEGPSPNDVRAAVDYSKNDCKAVLPVFSWENTGVVGSIWSKGSESACPLCILSQLAVPSRSGDFDRVAIMALAFGAASKWFIHETCEEQLGDSAAKAVLGFESRGKVWKQTAIKHPGCPVCSTSNRKSVRQAYTVNELISERLGPLRAVNSGGDQSILARVQSSVRLFGRKELHAYEGLGLTLEDARFGALCGAAAGLAESCLRELGAAHVSMDIDGRSSCKVTQQRSASENEMIKFAGGASPSEAKFAAIVRAFQFAPEEEERWTSFEPDAANWFLINTLTRRLGSLSFEIRNGGRLVEVRLHAKSQLFHVKHISRHLAERLVLETAVAKVLKSRRNCVYRETRENADWTSLSNEIAERLSSSLLFGEICVYPELREAGLSTAWALWVAK